MTPADYDFLRTVLKERSGLVLSDDKHYLVESRLIPIARKAGFADLDSLLSALRTAGEAPLLNTVVEAMMTNESLFFRDKTPFELFRATVLPALMSVRRTTRSIRIWCAAASTGQEPYSLAMCLKDMEREIAGFRVEILATDLSSNVLDKAGAGLYSQFEVQRGLPIALLIKHFSRDGELWQIAPEIRDMVTFRQFNLLDDFSGLGVFDLVFCRNVLIYFDAETKIDVLNRLAASIATDGYLVLGAAETVIGLTDRFRPVPDKRGLYAPNRELRRGSKPRLVALGGR